MSHPARASAQHALDHLPDLRADAPRLPDEASVLVSQNGSHSMNERLIDRTSAPETFIVASDSFALLPLAVGLYSAFVAHERGTTWKSARGNIHP
jgi:hypothetical protein